ncbi:MAG TPA: class I SAM-dependent methyltransferase [Stellaceae bacterium]|nr:class I SAM-dependent methyltransferase [Stellaceae bacterium]
MPIIARLVALYESRGITVATGLSPTRFAGFPNAPFTWFFKDGASVTNGLGIAMQEIYFFECLFARFRPERLFAIGNAAGWSTLALALLNPTAQIVAIDAGFDRNALDGIAFTNRIAAEEALAARVVEGKSPGDVPRILAETDLAPLDFVFIDGYHSIEQVQLDFRAVRPFGAPGCLYLFHDVANFALQPGIDRIVAETGFVARILPGTTSGMALLYNPAHPPTALDDIAPFAAAPATLGLIEAEAWKHRHRHLARWRRSLDKRLGRARSGGGFGDGSK